MNVSDAENLCTEEIRMLAKMMILALNQRARQDKGFAQRWYHKGPHMEIEEDEAHLRYGLLWLIQGGGEA